MNWKATKEIFFDVFLPIFGFMAIVGGILVFLEILADMYR